MCKQNEYIYYLTLLQVSNNNRVSYCTKQKLKSSSRRRRNNNNILVINQMCFSLTLIFYHFFLWVYIYIMCKCFLSWMLIIFQLNLNKTYTCEKTFFFFSNFVYIFKSLTIWEIIEIIFPIRVASLLAVREFIVMFTGYYCQLNLH